MPQVVGYYYDIPRARMLRCPFHYDRTPSFYIYDDHAFCFGGCRRRYDIFDFVERKEGISFAEAVEWLETHLAGIESRAVEFVPTYRDLRDAYVPPPPQEYQTYWGSLLTPDRRTYLNERLIDNATINYLGIGYRPDIHAFSIPFWGGYPWVSLVEIFQFRLDPLSLSGGGDGEWKYKGLYGHNRPALINQFVINPLFVVMFFGTLDAVLALQDGLPAISPNGASVFGRRLDVLAHKLGYIEHLYVVPDNTEGEYEFGELYADALGGHVALFPPGCKDYSEWRLSGKSVGDFVREVLKVGDEVLILGEDRLIVEELVDCILGGESVAAGERIAELEMRYETGVINHALQSVIWHRAPSVLGADLTARLLDMLAEAGGDHRRFWQVVGQWCRYLSRSNLESF